MSEIPLPRTDQVPTKLKTVPIAVTPEGFWCCPSPTVFQKTIKPQIPLNKPKSFPPEKKSNLTVTEKPPQIPPPRTNNSDAPVVVNQSSRIDKTPNPVVENAPKKVSIEFGDRETSDLKVILLGKQGVTVKLSVHRSVLVESSGFFAKKISEQQPIFPCFEINDCEDVEIYVDTIGLMYCCRELKQRLIKQSVSRVLRILKVSEHLRFTACIHSCLEHLEAVPWVGEEEEEKVLASVSNLQHEGIIVKPLLNRVTSNISKPPKETLSHILNLVLKSNDEKGRREMKSIVLKLLKEYNDPCNETLYASCRTSLETLSTLFRQAAAPDFQSSQAAKLIALESDNLVWLLDIIVLRQAGDEFAVAWADQHELSLLHAKLPITCRYYVSLVTSRIFVCIGRGEILPSKDTRLLLLQMWLEPLINDYKWLQNACRSFDRTVVDEGIGRTILTLPLEDQQSIFLSWLGFFLKGGDNCPNLRRAFEVWWRRTFVRPYEISREINTAMGELD